MDALPLYTTRPASALKEVVAGSPLTLPLALTGDDGQPLALAGRTVTYELRTASGALHASGTVAVTGAGTGTLTLGALYTTQGGVYFLRVLVREGGTVVAALPAGAGLQIPVPGAGTADLTLVRQAAEAAPVILRTGRQVATDRTATEAAMERAEALADNTGVFAVYPDRDAANAALAGLPNGVTVEVSRDETAGNVRWRYTVVAGDFENGVPLPVLSPDAIRADESVVPPAQLPVAVRPLPTVIRFTDQYMGETYGGEPDYAPTWDRCRGLIQAIGGGCTLLVPPGDYPVARYRWSNVTGFANQDPVPADARVSLVDSPFSDLSDVTIEATGATFRQPVGLNRALTYGPGATKIYSQTWVWTPIELLRCTRFRVVGGVWEGGLDAWTRDETLNTEGEGYWMRSRDCVDCTFEDVTARGYFDGALVGAGGSGGGPTGITPGATVPDTGMKFYDCTFDQMARQGYSVAGVLGDGTLGSGLHVRGGSVTNVGYAGTYGSHAPAAVVDVEPESGNGAYDILIEGVTATGCFNLVSAGFTTTSGRVLFDRCTLLRAAVGADNPCILGCDGIEMRDCTVDVGLGRMDLGWGEFGTTPQSVRLTRGSVTGSGSTVVYAVLDVPLVVDGTDVAVGGAVQPGSVPVLVTNPQARFSPRRVFFDGARHPGGNTFTAGANLGAASADGTEWATDLDPSDGAFSVLTPADTSKYRRQRFLSAAVQPFVDTVGAITVAEDAEWPPAVTTAYVDTGSLASGAATTVTVPRPVGSEPMFRAAGMNGTSVNAVAVGATVTALPTDTTATVTVVNTASVAQVVRVVYLLP